MKPETKIQNKIIGYIKKIPDLQYKRRQAGGFNYKSGEPDLWFVYRGRHVEVEVKAPGGIPTSLQLLREKEYRSAGALYWRGESFEDFKKFFEKNFEETTQDQENMI